MLLDHLNSSVTVSIAGLGLACINKRKRNRCEIGIIRCDRHKPLLDIQRIEYDRSGKPIRSSLVPHSLNLDEDILIDVISADDGEPPRCEKGVTTFTRREFNRLDDMGDHRDFRWVPDLEGPEFHNGKLRIKNRKKLQPTIFLSDGILYTREKTDEVFARISTNGKPAAVALGKVAHGINADISCVKGGAVRLSNVSESEAQEPGGRCPVTLEHRDGIRYLISIENLCELADESEGTDFRIFYDVLQDSEQKQFDLRRIVETGSYAAPEEALEDRDDFSLDGFPESCVTAFLGLTDSLLE
jgi:hypothetical protein